VFMGRLHWWWLMLAASSPMVAPRLFIGGGQP
jgi:hypothetical protein